MRRLRDEGIEILGWINGNSWGTTLGQHVAQMYGRGGEVYNLYVALSPPGGGEDEVVALGNVRRYRAAVERGKAEPMNMEMIEVRLTRFPQITQELTRLLRELEAAQSRKGADERPR